MIKKAGSFIENFLIRGPGRDIASPIQIPKKKISSKTLKSKFENKFDINSIFNRYSSFSEEPEYDLNLMRRACDVESLFMHSIRKHREQCLNKGATIDGDNQKTVDYIKKRLVEMSLAKWEPTYNVMAQIAHDLIKFSNAFVLKVRDEKVSSGKSHKVIGDKELKPIAGLEVMDPCIMKVKKNKKTGDVQKWIQQNDSETKEYSPDDVVHIHYNRETGFTFGAPAFLPAVEDARALRRIETIAELIPSKCAFPVYHISIGDPETGCQTFGERDEVDIFRDENPEMPSEGAIVTSYRVKIEGISSDPELDTRPILEYWKQRVLGGLNLSTIDVGQGDSANRSTAHSLNQNAIEFVKEIQKVMEEFISFYIFNELLIEGGYNLTPDNMVYMKFHEVDIEAEMARDNHALNQFQGNLWPRERALKYQNKTELTEEESNDMFFENVTLKEIKAKTASEIAVSREGAKLSGGQPSTSKTSSEGRTKQLAQPKNQTGEKTKAVTRPKQDFFDYQQESKTLSQEFIRIWNDLNNQIVNMIETESEKDEIIKVIEDSTQQFLNTARPYTISAASRGRDDFHEDAGKIQISSNLIDLSDFQGFFSKYTDSTLKRLNKNLSDNDYSNKEDIQEQFDRLQYRLRFMANNEIKLAYVYGYAKTAEWAGLDKVYVHSSDDSCESCQTRKFVVKLGNIKPNNLRDPHPNCNCRVSIHREINNEYKTI